eukprot:scaffold73747_cov36-Tisochrysis_lutea.AAC.1
MQKRFKRDARGCKRDAKGMLSFWALPSKGIRSAHAGCVLVATNKPLWDLVRALWACKVQQRKKRYVGRETLPTSIKEKETHCLRRAMSVLHQKDRTKKKLGRTLLKYKKTSPVGVPDERTREWGVPLPILCTRAVTYTP